MFFEAVTGLCGLEFRFCLFCGKEDWVISFLKNT